MQNDKGQILGHMLAPGQKLFDFAQTGAKAFFCRKEHIETIFEQNSTVFNLHSTGTNYVTLGLTYDLSCKKYIFWPCEKYTFLVM